MSEYNMKNIPTEKKKVISCIGNFNGMYRFQYEDASGKIQYFELTPEQVLDLRKELINLFIDKEEEIKNEIAKSKAEEFIQEVLKPFYE